MTSPFFLRQADSGGRQSGMDPLCSGLGLQQPPSEGVEQYELQVMVSDAPGPRRSSPISIPTERSRAWTRMAAESVQAVSMECATDALVRRRVDAAAGSSRARFAGLPSVPIERTVASRGRPRTEDGCTVASLPRAGGAVPESVSLKGLRYSSGRGPRHRRPLPQPSPTRTRRTTTSTATATATTSTTTTATELPVSPPGSLQDNLNGLYQSFENDAKALQDLYEANQVKIPQGYEHERERKQVLQGYLHTYKTRERQYKQQKFDMIVDEMAALLSKARQLGDNRSLELECIARLDTPETIEPMETSERQDSHDRGGAHAQGETDPSWGQYFKIKKQLERDLEGIKEALKDVLEGGMPAHLFEDLEVIERMLAIEPGMQSPEPPEPESPPQSPTQSDAQCPIVVQ